MLFQNFYGLFRFSTRNDPSYDKLKNRTFGNELFLGENTDIIFSDL